MEKTNKLDTFNLKELLGLEGANYFIPIYQRNYAWEEQEISQLIQDISDSVLQDSQKTYYIGTLVVSGEETEFSTVDGQQRLTSLTILLSVLKNNFKEVSSHLSWFTELKLQFNNRTKSTNSLKAAFSGEITSVNDIEHNSRIFSAYKICINTINKVLIENKQSLESFVDYLCHKVKIIRAVLPSDIDLNHYFEIMNSRGEQLEKHEVLKAQLMAVFNSNLNAENDNPAAKKNKYVFNLIWEACSNMEKYVQYGFTPSQRDLIFGKANWDSLIIHDFDKLVEVICGESPFIEGEGGFELEEILDSKLQWSGKEEIEEDSPERFNTVINFQNFLLQVLRVQLNKDVPLDDKRLISSFSKYLKQDTHHDEIEFVKTFAFNLLKCKFLTDKYIIKREFKGGEDRWSLKKLQMSNKKISYKNTFSGDDLLSPSSANRRVLMLLSMFHVSTPTMVRKYWFNAALLYLSKRGVVDAQEYINYLEHIVKAFVYDRYLSETPSDYYEIIHENIVLPSRDLFDRSKLSYGAIENNLVFNYLDYLLWLKYSDEEKISKFEFSFRSSVEHYYPQNPITGEPLSDKNLLNSFGNLCLISHSKNSRLSNHIPEFKKSYYHLLSIDSVKQHLMMKLKNTWSIDTIKQHEEDMLRVLRENVNSSYNEKLSQPNKGMIIFEREKASTPTELVRLLMCFGDIKSYAGTIADGWEKYSFYAWDFIETTDAYKGMLEFAKEFQLESSAQIIRKFLEKENIATNDYRYLFVNYPSIIEYCEAGQFGPVDLGYPMFLLNGSKRTQNKSKELYMFLLEKHLMNSWGITLFGSYEGLFISAIINDEGDFLPKEYASCNIQLALLNVQNQKVIYHVISKLHGNKKLYKSFFQNGWIQNENGHLVRESDKGILCNLTDDYKVNSELIFELAPKLLKKWGK